MADLGGCSNSGGRKRPFQRLSALEVLDEIMNDDDSVDGDLYDNGESSDSSDEDERSGHHPLVVRHVVGATGDGDFIPDSVRENDSDDSSESDSESEYTPSKQQRTDSVARAGCSTRGRGRRGRGRGRGVARGRARNVRAPPQFAIRHWEVAPPANPNQDVAFTGQPGINTNVEDFEPVDFMQLYFDNDLFNCLVIETNRYADQFMESNRDLSEKSRAKDWEPVSFEDIKKFLGLVILMGLVKMPTIDMYWSHKILYKMPIFSSIMSRNRFQTILKFLHFHNNAQMPARNEEGYDRLYKIKPILDHLFEKFQEVFTPRKCICVDESLLLWKGRLQFRQYIPLKRARFGIKMYLCCESDGDVRGSGGYCYRMKVYAGKEDPVHDIRAVIPADAAELSISEQMVVFLMAPLLNQGYTVFTDNWYTSLRLHTYLLRKKTLACGTVRANRGVPDQLQNIALQPGGSAAVIGDNKVVATKYHSTKVVHLMSTAHGHGEKPIPDRRQRGITKRPIVSTEYNRNMGGVDKQDQLITPYDCTRKSMKWTKKLFFHLMQVAAVNAFLLARKSGYDKRFLNFLESLILSWILPDPASLVYQPCDTDDVVRLKDRHFVDFLPPTAKKSNPTKPCRVCTKKLGVRRDTRYHCPDCPSKPGLCLSECFRAYHTKFVFWK